MPATDPDSGPPDPGLTDEFSTVLVGITRLVRRRLRQELTVPRLRGAQVELLRLVAANPGLRVSAAAKELCLAGNSVSTLVNQLVAEGLLLREVDPADRRAALLRVTPPPPSGWTAGRPSARRWSVSCSPNSPPGTARRWPPRCPRCAGWPPGCKAGTARPTLGPGRRRGRRRGRRHGR